MYEDSMEATSESAGCRGVSGARQHVLRPLLRFNVSAGSPPPDPVLTLVPPSPPPGLWRSLGRSAVFRNPSSVSVY